jgi:predicted nucleotidyltransferase
MGMELMEKIIRAADAVRLHRYPEAAVAYAAGSFIRGEATAYSDLDLVVIYGRLAHAYRESFHFEDIPVEAFVHDPETLNYFFMKVDRPSGVPSLMQMVVEGVAVPGPNAISESLKELAASVIQMGPPALTAKEQQTLRYGITDLIDDIRDPRSYEELVATGSRLYESMANYYFRRNGRWSASGKSIPRLLARTEHEISKRFNESFDTLFRQGDPAAVIAFASEILHGDGGFLFDGHRVEAPAEWRTPLPDRLQ